MILSCCSLIVLSGIILDDDNFAEDRIRRLPTEDHMVLVEGTLQNPADSAPAEADGELKSMLSLT